MKMSVDNHKLMYHVSRVADWKAQKLIYPIYVEAGLTNACNQRCKYCALSFTEYKPVFVKKQPMLDALEEMGKYGVKSIMFAGEGEPLLDRNCAEYVQTAKDNGMDIAITTNGTLLLKERAEQILPNLSWIRFSISAGVPTTYGKLHGIAPKFFSQTLKNVEDAVKVKQTRHLAVHIGVQFLLLDENAEEAYMLGQKVRDLGVDSFQIKPYTPHPGNPNNLTADYSNTQKLEDELMKLNTKSFQVLFRSESMRRIQEKGGYKECLGLDFFALITAEGNIIPCNLFYGKPEYYYGNIEKNTFSEIWEGYSRVAVKDRLKKMGVDKCRDGCRLDPCNRYLDRLKHPHEHDNFI